MIIDTHVHLENGALPPELIGMARKLEVEKFWVSSLGTWAHEPSHQECIQANQETRRVMQEYPDLVMGYVYVNPKFPEALEEFERGIEGWGMIGLKLWVAAHCTDERTFPLFEKAQEFEVPVLVHAWHKATGNLPFESTPSQVAEAARLFPQVKLLLAHGGGDWQRGIRAIQETPNVLFETGGSIVEQGMVEAAVEALGPERVIFGSDAPGTDLSVMLAKVQGAEIDDSVKKLVLGGNAARLLGDKLK